MVARPGALLLLLGACGPAERAADPRPDVVLVSIDSLRADHLGCYGYAPPTSPTIDRLAREGVLFEDAVSTTSWTLPAHAALFTGLWDSSHGLVDNGLRLGDEHATLAEVLRDAGYRTAGFYGGPYLHPTFGLHQGFEVYESCMTTVPQGWSAEEIRADSRSKEARSHADVTGPRTLERVEAWLATLPPRGERPPFFLFVHLWDVHYDFVAPPEYVELFDPGYEGPVDGRSVEAVTHRPPDWSDADVRHLVSLYDGEILWTDELVQRILRKLVRAGHLGKKSGRGFYLWENGEIAKEAPLP